MRGIDWGNVRSGVGFYLKVALCTYWMAMALPSVLNPQRGADQFALTYAAGWLLYYFVRDLVWWWRYER